LQDFVLLSPYTKAARTTSVTVVVLEGVSVNVYRQSISIVDIDFICKDIVKGYIIVVALLI
jgi:hypothetical protein